MRDLIAVQKIAQWQRLKTLVLDGRADYILDAQDRQLEHRYEFDRNGRKHDRQFAGHHQYHDKQGRHQPVGYQSCCREPSNALIRESGSGLHAPEYVQPRREHNAQRTVAAYL